MVEKIPFTISVTITGSAANGKSIRELQKTIQDATKLGCDVMFDNIPGSVDEIKIHTEIDSYWVDGRYRGSYRD